MTITGGPPAAAGAFSPSATRRPSAPAGSIRVPWLVLAAAAFALAVVVVLWTVDRAADRTQVVVVRNPISAGSTIVEDDLTTTGVASDQGFGRIYTADQLSALVGATARVDLGVGDLVGPSVLTGAPLVAPDERLVGATLRVGRYPLEAAPGQLATAIDLEDDSTSTRAEARIVRIDITETGEASITLAVAAEEAAAVAAWAGRDRLALVVAPSRPDEGDS